MRQDDVTFPSVIGLLGILCATIATPTLSAEPAHANNAPLRVAILHDNVLASTPALAEELSATMTQAGVSVMPVTCDQLSDPTILNIQRFDCLMLPNSPQFPIAAKDNFLQYLRSGGDLVLMGGHAFQDPLVKHQGQWVSKKELMASLTSLRPEQLLFSFDDGDFTGWTRATNNMDNPSDLAAGTGKVGRGMEVRIKALDAWDMWHTLVSSTWPTGHNVLCFWAKGDHRTSRLTVTLDDKEGSNWTTHVNLTTQWQHYALPTHKFNSRTNVRRKNRPKPLLRMDNIKRICFGLAVQKARLSRGDHTFWLDEVGSVSVDLPPSDLLISEIKLNVFSDYEPYVLKDIKQIVAYPHQNLLSAHGKIEGDFEGVSAVGFPLPDESTFVPILSAIDRSGRERGWAAGLLVNHAGQYQGSHWLLFGITSPAFYQSPGFVETLVTLLKAMNERDLAEKALQIRGEAGKTNVAVTQQVSEGRLRISGDDKHILYPDGKRFFMIGCNYVPHVGRPSFWSDKGFDADTLEADFQHMRSAGINCIRMFTPTRLLDDSDKKKTLLACAEKYGVHLLMVITVHALYGTGPELAEQVHKVVNTFKNEPIVLGYDLQNEPYVGDIGSIQLGAEPSPILKLRPYTNLSPLMDKVWVDRRVDQHGPWKHPRIGNFVKKRETLQDLYAAYSIWRRSIKSYIQDNNCSSFPSLTSRLAVDPEYQAFYEAVNETFSQWIEFQVNIIRKLDPSALVTVGYNTILDALRANDQLDFVSHHAYQLPYSCEDVMKNVVTLDRLAEIRPSQPASFGEFGYSNGDIMPDGEHLDFHTSAVGEMIHYLHCYARGYAGACKWKLTDVSLPVSQRYCKWAGPELDGYIRQGRFGLYWPDGTPGGRPKPIAWALGFLRDYVDQYEPQPGTIEVKPGPTRIGAVYVYQGKQALFVGDVEYDSPELQFKTLTGKPTNMMLTWNDGEIKLMTTADARVRLNPSRLIPAMTANRVNVAGRHGSLRQQGQFLIIHMLQGETLVIR